MSDRKYKVWGEQHIDPKSFEQMDAAMSIPPAVMGAMMPDAHIGYGLPIGGVLGLDGAVCPYAVGVDIACRMKLSIFEIDPKYMEAGHGTQQDFVRALRRNTMFGVGVENRRGYDHPVLADGLWPDIDVLWENKEKARNQLGTSGSGNHFVEFGELDVPDYGRSCACEELDIAVGKYVAVMSHSGSRGAGAAVCKFYSDKAKELLKQNYPALYENPLTRDLGWLDLDSQAGREYWDAMNLMGRYAAANHDCIHNAIAADLGMRPLKQIENHHNYAWKEQHNGREVIVHRKGATPAGRGVLGIIPGSMGTSAYVVSGLANADSLNSASHGAGRLMSRKQARATFDFKTEIARLRERGILVLQADADEVCGAYKNIDDVMACQSDLVEPVAKFSPKIVMMCGGGERAED